MEFTEVVSPHVALPVLGVLICAILVFAFGFKSPAQPPSFDFEDDSRKKKSKKSKTKNQSNGHAVSPTEIQDSGVNKQHLPPKQSVKQQQQQSLKQQQQSVKQVVKQQQQEQSPTVKATKQKEDKVESGKKNKKQSPPTNVSAETKAKKTVAKEGEWQTLVSRKKKGKKESTREDSVVRQEAVDEKPVGDQNEKKKKLDDPQPIIEDETDVPSAKEMAVKKRKDRKNKKAKPDNEPWEDLEEKQTTVVQEGKKHVKQPVLVEKQPVLAVKQLVLEAKPQVREPILEVKQPVLEVKPDVKQPKADVKQPKADVKQPKADVKQPIPEVKELGKTDDKTEVSTTKTSPATEESQSKKKAKSKKEKRKSSSPSEPVEELKQPEPEIHKKQPKPEIHKKQPEPEIHKKQPEPEIHKKQPEPEIPKKSISITTNPFPKSQQVEEKEEKSPVLSVAEPEFETVRSPKKKKSKDKNKKSVETEVSPVKDEVITDTTSSSVARDRLSPQIRYSAEPESSAKTEDGDGDMATKSVDSSKTPNLSFDELSESWIEAKPKSKKKKPRREN